MAVSYTVTVPRLAAGVGAHAAPNWAASRSSTSSHSNAVVLGTTQNITNSGSTNQAGGGGVIFESSTNRTYKSNVFTTSEVGVSRGTTTLNNGVNSIVATFQQTSTRSGSMVQIWSQNLTETVTSATVYNQGGTTEVSPSIDPGLTGVTYSTNTTTFTSSVSSSGRTTGAIQIVNNNQQTTKTTAVGRTFTSTKTTTTDVTYYSTSLNGTIATTCNTDSTNVDTTVSTTGSTTSYPGRLSTTTTASTWMVDGGGRSMFLFATALKAQDATNINELLFVPTVAWTSSSLETMSLLTDLAYTTDSYQFPFALMTQQIQPLAAYPWTITSVSSSVFNANLFINGTAVFQIMLAVATSNGRVSFQSIVTPATTINVTTRLTVTKTIYPISYSTWPYPASSTQATNTITSTVPTTITGTAQSFSTQSTAGNAAVSVAYLDWFAITATPPASVQLNEAPLSTRRFQTTKTIRVALAYNSGAASYTSTVTGSTTLQTLTTVASTVVTPVGGPDAVVAYVFGDAITSTSSSSTASNPSQAAGTSAGSTFNIFPTLDHAHKETTNSSHIRMDIVNSITWTTPEPRISATYVYPFKSLGIQNDSAGYPDDPMYSHFTQTVGTCSIVVASKYTTTETLTFGTATRSNTTTSTSTIDSIAFSSMNHTLISAINRFFALVDVPYPLPISGTFSTAYNSYTYTITSHVSFSQLQLTVTYIAPIIFKETNTTYSSTSTYSSTVLRTQSTSFTASGSLFDAQTFSTLYGAITAGAFLPAGSPILPVGLNPGFYFSNQEPFLILPRGGFLYTLHDADGARSVGTFKQETQTTMFSSDFESVLSAEFTALALAPLMAASVSRVVINESFNTINSTKKFWYERASLDTHSYSG